MRRTLSIFLAILTLTVPAQAWNATGHMTVAYVAYKLLNTPVREHIDTLLKLNPQYQTWIAGAPPGEQGLVAFMNAAVWPDCIKGSQCPGYTSDGPNGGNLPPGDSSASQNIGYADHAMHKYWHFVDLPYATGGLPGPSAPVVNAVSQIVMFRAALAGKSSADVKSYDIAWLVHLVGDIHQPLHAIQRYTVIHPSGDAGGNLIRFCNAPCDSPDNLHAYWDNLMGTQTDLNTIKSLATALLEEPRPAGRNSTDVQAWSQQSAGLAKQYAYASPISLDNDPHAPLSPRPDSAYDARARRVAWEQVLLAAYRLAFLLNTNLRR